MQAVAVKLEGSSGSAAAAGAGGLPSRRVCGGRPRPAAQDGRHDPGVDASAAPPGRCTARCSWRWASAAGEAAELTAGGVGGGPGGRRRRRAGARQGRARRQDDGRRAAAGGRGAEAAPPAERRSRRRCERAAAAAEQGMRATIPLVARKGRASYLGERSAGHQDPGATSSWLLLRDRRRDCSPAERRGGSDAVIGLVLVSHSARLAEGVAELAAQMARQGRAHRGRRRARPARRPLGTDAAPVAAGHRRGLVARRRAGPDGPGQRRALGGAGARPAAGGAARARAADARRRSSRAPSPRLWRPASATPSRRWPRRRAGALAAKAASPGAEPQRLNRRRDAADAAAAPQAPAGMRCRGPSCGSWSPTPSACTRVRPRCWCARRPASRPM